MNVHPILPLAEMASVFCENIVTDTLLTNETDQDAKISLIADKLEDIFATSHRQNMFSRFEMAIHDRCKTSRLSSDELCDIYTQELLMMFGETVAVLPEYRWEWASIPHIVAVPFYVYAYNFGNLLVMALYQRYQENSHAFKPIFKEMLRMGSSMSANDIARMGGIDIEDQGFWETSLGYVRSLIDQLERLVASRLHTCV